MPLSIQLSTLTPARHRTVKDREPDARQSGHDGACNARLRKYRCCVTHGCREYIPCNTNVWHKVWAICASTVLHACMIAWLCSQAAQHSTAQHSTAQHSTAQHSTAQHSHQSEDDGKTRCSPVLELHSGHSTKPRVPAEGAKSLKGSSALILTSIAWPLWLGLKSTRLSACIRFRSSCCYRSTHIIRCMTNAGCLFPHESLAATGCKTLCLALSHLFHAQFDFDAGWF